MKKISALLLYTFSLFGIYNLKAQQGLKGDYYDGDNFQKYVATRIDSKIDLSWLIHPPVAGINPRYCSIRWTGRLFAPESGTYTFSTLVDDGVRVWIGNVKVIDAWDLHDSEDFKGKIVLEKGKLYDFKVEYFNAMIEGEIHLLWELPSDKGSFWSFFSSTAKVVGPSYFYQVPEPPTPPKPINTSIAEKLVPKKTAPPLSKTTINKPKPPVVTSKTPTPKSKIVSADTIQKYTPKNILFEQSKSIMLGESFNELDNLAAFLKRYPKLMLIIEGHTDNIGDTKLNLTLSEERAQAVMQYLVDKGIATNRIQAKGYGSSRPLINDNNTAGHLQNRRVEFIIR